MQDIADRILRIDDGHILDGASLSIQTSEGERPDFRRAQRDV